MKAPARPRLRLLPACVLEQAFGLPPALAARCAEPAGDPVQVLAEAHAPERRAALLCAHMLPADAVWAVCLLLRLALQRGWAPPSAHLALLEQVEAWRRGQGDAWRYQAQEQAAALGYAQPIPMLALAAFLSGPSLAPPNMAAVAPAGHAGAVAARAACALAVQQCPAIGYADFVAFAEELVAGGNGARAFGARNSAAPAAQPAGAA